jgi:kumamolisin
MSDSKRVPLAGTEHLALAGVRTIGPTDPHQLIEVSVVLKHRQPLPAANEIRQQITHTDFARTYGADPAAVDKIRQFASENNLQGLERGDEVLRRTVTMAGTGGNGKGIRRRIERI